MKTLVQILKEVNSTFFPMYHGGKIDFSKPVYFSSNKIVASSYGNVESVCKITFQKPVIIDFSSAEGWWLPEKYARIEAKKLGMELDDFDKYKKEKRIKDVKTDHFVKAAKDQGFDGVIFQNIIDAGSLPIKANKYIRTTNVVVLNPKKSIRIMENL